jgi:hypothetical protein
MLTSMPEQALAYLRSADRVDPVAALAKVQAPVLILQGGRDNSVPAAHADLLRKGRPSLPTNFAIFPNLNHFYKEAPPGLPPMQSMGLETDSDPAVADAIAAWANQLSR